MNTAEDQSQRQNCVIQPRASVTGDAY